MISVYWPYKRVPEWLQKVEAERFGLQVAINPIHKGFGVTAKANGKFFVWVATGTFMYIKGNGCSLKIKGQGRGVNVYTSFFAFMSDVINEIKIARRV